MPTDKLGVYFLSSSLGSRSHCLGLIVAVVGQLTSAWLSEREVSGSIFSDVNVCFDFPLIRVAIALNTRKTKH